QGLGRGSAWPPVASARDGDGWQAPTPGVGCVAQLATVASCVKERLANRGRSERRPRGLAAAAGGYQPKKSSRRWCHHRVCASRGAVFFSATAWPSPCGPTAGTTPAAASPGGPDGTGLAAAAPPGTAAAVTASGPVRPSPNEAAVPTRCTDPWTNSQSS